jgi:hypothetical protein
MSTERHPNINAAGLTCDVITVFRERLRGAAGASDEAKNRALQLCRDEFALFVDRVDELLDSEFTIQVAKPLRGKKPRMMAPQL